MSTNSSRFPSLEKTNKPSEYGQLAQSMDANNELKPVLNAKNSFYINKNILNSRSPDEESLNPNTDYDQNNTSQNMVIVNGRSHLYINYGKPESQAVTQPNQDPSMIPSQVYQQSNNQTNNRIYDKDPTGEDLKNFEVIRKKATTQLINDLAHLSRYVESQNVSIKIEISVLSGSSTNLISEVPCPFKLNFTILLARSSLFKSCFRKINKDQMDKNILLLKRLEKNDIGIRYDKLSGTDQYNLILDLDQQNQKINEYKIALNELRSYLYSGSCEINKAIDFPLFTLAIAFKIGSLIKYLVKHFKKELKNKIDRVFEILEFSWNNREQCPDLVDLKKDCIGFINDKGLRAIYNKEYEKLAEAHSDLVMEMFFENK